MLSECAKKYCVGCEKRGINPWKPLSEFNKRSGRLCGLQSRCRNCQSSYFRERCQDDPEFVAKHRTRSAKWARDNPEKRKRWAGDNKHKAVEYSAKWCSNNRERVREKQNGRNKERYKTDLNYKIKCLLRTRIGCVIKQSHKPLSKKAGSAVFDLGCSIEEFISYLETKFAPDMTWDNHGTLWEVDHIRRLADFDLTNREQFLKAAHYTNLQPLWIEEHLKKTKQETYGVESSA